MKTQDRANYVFIRQNKVTSMGSFTEKTMVLGSKRGKLKDSVKLEWLQDRQ